MSLLSILFTAVAAILSIPVLLFGYVLYSDFKAKRKIRNEKGEPIRGPNTFTIIKNQFIRKMNPAQIEPIYKEQFGDVFMMNIGPMQNVVISKPEHVKRALLEWRNFPKMNFAERVQKGSAFHRFGTENVAFLNGEDWQRQRKMMDPSFVNLEEFVKPFVNETKLCMEVIEKRFFASASAKESTTVDVHDVMQRFTLEVLGKTIFGFNFNYLDGKPSKYLISYNYIMSNMFSTVLQFIIPFYHKIPLASNIKMMSNFDVLDELIYKLIDETKAKLEQKKETNESKTLLEMMVEANLAGSQTTNSEEAPVAALSAKELRDNIFIFFLAGHETSANSLCFALYSMAKNQKIQEQMYQEVVEKIGKTAEPTYESIKECEYMGLVLKETLRMYPPATGVVGRKCSKDEKFGEFVVPKGTTVRASIYLLHHDKETWGDPEVFRPERFLPEESKTRPTFCYFPFGGGPRLCIGNNFSLLEQKIFLASLLQKYTIHLDDPNYTMKFAPQNGILQPSSDYNLKLVRRE